MHETFVFPMDCKGLMDRWDSPEGITFIDVDSHIVKGRIIKGKPNIEGNSSYDPFEFDCLIPEFIKMIERMLDGVSLEKSISKWFCEWGPLYSVIFSNTTENFLNECIKFYTLWDFYKLIANHEKEKLMENILLEEYDAYYKVTFFPDEFTFSRDFTSSISDLLEDDFDFEYSFPVGKKINLDLFEEIRMLSAQFFFKQIEKYTSRANLHWGSMRQIKKESRSEFRIEPVLQVENLIDAIYLQFYILFSENEKKICPVCNTPFVPERKDKKYCSQSCKLTAKSRRYRARKII